MQEKFTPGPWHIEGDEWIDDQYSEPICHFPEEQVIAANVRANMNLIKAAPEMARALRHVINILESINLQEKGIAYSVLSQARAALSKAYGLS